jgi:hypothetical protein
MFVEETLVGRYGYITGSSQALSLSDLHILLEKNAAKSRYYKDLIKYVGDLPLHTFVSEIIEQDLTESGEYHKDRSYPVFLTTSSAYSDPESSSQRLVGELDSLPWNYVVSFGLPKDAFRNIYQHGVTRTLSDSISIVCPDNSDKDQLPLRSGIEKRDGMLFGGRLWSGFSGEKERMEVWDQQRCYLRLNVQGFIGAFSHTEPLKGALSAIKSFLGLCVGGGVASVEAFTNVAPAVSEDYVIIHSIRDEAQILRTLDVPEDIRAICDKMIPIKTESGSEEMVRRLAAISTIYRRADETFPSKGSDGARANQLIRAAEWYIDSYAGTDVFFYIRAMVAMEALLGSGPDGKDIRTLLSNRCAYLLGSSHREREEILETVKQLYDLRSSIVHRGHRRLMLDQRVQFARLLYLCRRVLAEEIRLAVKDAEPVGRGASIRA